jgi:hypothetical protein
VLTLLRSRELRDIRETHQRLAADLNELKSSILPRIQRVERDLISAKLCRFLAELHVAIQLSVQSGLRSAQAIETGLRAVVAPLPRGVAGGLARTKNAWRYSNGTFMSDAERAAAIEEFEVAEYERYAAGGRARAAKAKRSQTGTFLPGQFDT